MFEQYIFPAHASMVSSVQLTKLNWKRDQVDRNKLPQYKTTFQSRNELWRNIKAVHSRW